MFSDILVVLSILVFTIGFLLALHTNLRTLVIGSALLAVFTNMAVYALLFAGLSSFLP